MVSRDTPVRAATLVSGATPLSSAQASATRARSPSACDAIRLRDSASSNVRPASDKLSGQASGSAPAKLLPAKFPTTQDTSYP